MTIPTVQECVDSAIAAIESALGQDVPVYEKSFLRVLSVVLGMTNAELYRFGVQRAKQVLALTAVGDDLTALGYEYGIRRKLATKAVVKLLVFVEYTGDVYLNMGDSVYCDSTDMYYFLMDDYYWPANSASQDIFVRAEFAGAQGNVEDLDETFSFSSQPDNLSGPTYAFVSEAGVDEETDDELRIRILDEIQSVGGGSNMADYRTWGQRTPNVARIDPYTGKEVPGDPTSWDTSVPGERTVYVEATTSYDADGLADSTLLDLVTDYINYDQDTGERQPCLGSTDDTLYVKSITRYPVYFTIHNLVVPDTTRYYDCQVAIEETLTTLAWSMRPFILGLDAEAFRNDTMTPSLASRHVQRVVQAFGGTVGSVDVALSAGGSEQSIDMNPGERFSAVVNYV